MELSLQDILLCGTVGFQVISEPTHSTITAINRSRLSVTNNEASSSKEDGIETASSSPASLLSISSSSTATAATSPNSNSPPQWFNNDPTNGNFGAGGGTIVSSGGTLGAAPPPMTKYTFLPLNFILQKILSKPTNVCALNLNNIQQVPPHCFSPSDFDNKFLITRCDDCSLCPNLLPALHQLLFQMAIQSELISLFVIIDKRIENQGIRLIDLENSLVRIAYMDFENSTNDLTPCQYSESYGGDGLKSFSKTSVLFVSISFIILMIISLAWLIFYYIQRFRSAHAKDRLQRRLNNAAKKALTRIPTKPVKIGDKEFEDLDCPVCIDPYRAGDICRQLPCRHIFHKSCVDPWLLEHRTCPMCKSDILKACGYHLSSNRQHAQFSGHADLEIATNGSDSHRDIEIHSPTSVFNHHYPLSMQENNRFEFNSSNSPQIFQPIQTRSGSSRVFSALPTNRFGNHHFQNLANSSESYCNSKSFSKKNQPASQNSRSSRAVTAGIGGILWPSPHVVNLVHVRSRSISYSDSSGKKPVLGTHSFTDSSPPGTVIRRTMRQPPSSPPLSHQLGNSVLPTENKNHCKFAPSSIRQTMPDISLPVEKVFSSDINHRDCAEDSSKPCYGEKNCCRVVAGPLPLNEEQEPQNFFSSFPSSSSAAPQPQKCVRRSPTVATWCLGMGSDGFDFSHEGGIAFHQMIVPPNCIEYYDFSVNNNDKSAVPSSVEESSAPSEKISLESGELRAATAPNLCAIRRNKIFSTLPQDGGEEKRYCFTSSTKNAYCNCQMGNKIEQN